MAFALRPTLPAPHLPALLEREHPTTPQGQEEGAEGAGAGSVSAGELMRVGGGPEVSRGSCGDCPGRGSMVKRGDKEGGLQLAGCGLGV